MMKLVCYINKLNSGGAERVMSILANELAKRGHDVTLVTDYSFDNEYELSSLVNRISLDRHYGIDKNASFIKKNIKRIICLRKICKESKTDALVSFIKDANYRAIISTAFLKTRNIISIRIDPKRAYKNRFVATLVKAIYMFAEGVVFQTQEAKEYYPIKIQNRSEIILNPIDPAFFRIDSMPLAKKRIVSCGRLSKQKRFDLLIEAFSVIHNEFPEYSLHIYGSGEQKENLNKRIINAGLSDCVLLEGRSSDIISQIKDAYVFVLSSDFEGLPNALMEAMALGLPVVSTDCSGGGARALLGNDDFGIVVPRDDPLKLAEAIRKIICFNDIAKKYSRLSKERAVTFSTDNVIDKWESYIRHVIREE